MEKAYWREERIARATLAMALARNPDAASDIPKATNWLFLEPRGPGDISMLAEVRHLQSRWRLRVIEQPLFIDFGLFMHSDGHTTSSMVLRGRYAVCFAAVNRVVAHAEGGIEWFAPGDRLGSGEVFGP